jgi:hypothetical protein
MERPDPLTVWQLDFKDASTVPADPEGKQRHVVKVLNTVDEGTSLVLNAQVRDDFRTETTLRPVSETFRQHGLPVAVIVDRDPRFVGSTRQRDCPSLFERFCLCLGAAAPSCRPVVRISIVLSNATTARMKKSACASSSPVIWARCAR